MPLGFGNNAESLQSPDRMLPLFNIRGKVHSRRLSQEEIGRKVCWLYCIAQNMSNAAILKKNAITMHIGTFSLHFYLYIKLFVFLLIFLSHLSQI